MLAQTRIFTVIVLVALVQNSPAEETDAEWIDSDNVGAELPMAQALVDGENTDLGIINSINNARL